MLDYHYMREKLLNQELVLHSANHPLYKTRLKNMATRKAAVLIAFMQGGHDIQDGHDIQSDGEDRLLLTVRSKNLTHHAGQISFPGGRMDEDDMDAIHTAKRETFEEIGHPSDQIEIWGHLPSFVTGTGYEIFPVMGGLLPPFSFTCNPKEVAELFYLPLSYALELKNYHEESYAMQGVNYRLPVLDWQGRHIWGATASMLHAMAKMAHSA